MSGAMTSAELVAALRWIVEGRVLDGHPLLQAADLIERVEALRRLLPCPTCGGTGWVVNDDTGYTVHAGYKCNECPDGFMPWERIVFVTRNAMTASPDGFADAESVLLHLRAVRPAGETSGR